MSNILFLCLPEQGHVFPTISIAKRLAGYGHRVIYLAHDTFNPLLSACGFVTESLMGRQAGAPGHGHEQTGWSFWYEFECAHAPKSRGTALAELISAVVRRHQIDLVVADWLFASAYHVPFNLILGSKPCVVISATLLNWDHEVDTKGYPMLVLCPEELEIPRFRHRNQLVRYVEGSLYFHQNDGSVLAPVAPVHVNRRTPILVSFGTQSTLALDLERRCAVVAELARERSDLQIMLVLGRLPSIKSWLVNLQDIENLTVRGEVLQWRELKEMSLFITHGGLGSVKEALFQGVPMVVVPTGFDQPFNAMRIKHHRLGDYLFPDRLSVGALQKVLDRVFSSREDSENISNFRRLIRHSEQHPIAAEFIHSLTERSNRNRD